MHQPLFMLIRTGGHRGWNAYGTEIDAEVFAFPGTSEDAALILAYEQKAELIVAVGSHTNMIDFEKGRSGLPYFLVRLKVGYKAMMPKASVAPSKQYSFLILLLCLHCTFPLAMIINVSPLIRNGIS